MNRCGWVASVAVVVAMTMPQLANAQEYADEGAPAGDSSTPTPAPQPAVPPTRAATTVEAPSRAGPVILGTLFGQVLCWGLTASVVLTGPHLTETSRSTGRWIAGASVGAVGAWLGVLGADAIWGLRGRAWPALLGAAAGGTLFVIALGINAATAPSWGVDKYLVWPAIPGMTALVANELAVAFTPARASARTRSAITWTPSFFSSASGGPWGIQVTGRFS